MTLEELVVQWGVSATVLTNKLAELERDHGRDKVISEAGQLTELAARALEAEAYASGISIERMRKYVEDRDGGKGQVPTLP